MTCSIAGTGRPVARSRMMSAGGDIPDAMMGDMRVSVTLDPDVAASIQEFMNERNRTLEQAVNDTLRVGLASERSTISRRIVDQALLDLDTALDVAAALGDQVLIEKLNMRA